MNFPTHGMASLLLVLFSFGTQASSSSLLQLILPDKREITLDEAALAALPQVEFETATPWTLGTHRYRGPTLKSVLAAQQVDSASAIDVAALNGYQQRVDLSLFAKVPLTLVRYQDDKPLTRRNKGPLWLLVPLSAHPDMDVSAIHNNMVWQVIRIEVVP
ncbi:putative pterin-binding protein [Aeromonas caviae]